MGTRNEWFFPKCVKVDSCAVANLLEVFEDNNFGCKVCISFHVGILIKFDSAPESVKKSISKISFVDWKSLFFGLSKRSGFAQIFSVGSCTLFVIFVYIICIWTSFKFFFGIVCCCINGNLKMIIIIVLIIIRFYWRFVFTFDLKHVYWKRVFCFALIICGFANYVI